MGIGVSVFLLAAGAIIKFALNIDMGWLDKDVVGWVLMACGALGLIITIGALNRRRRTVVTPAPGATTTERRVVEDVPEYDVDRPL